MDKYFESPSAGGRGLPSPLHRAESTRTSLRRDDLVTEDYHTADIARAYRLERIS